MLIEKINEELQEEYLNSSAKTEEMPALQMDIEESTPPQPKIT